jgi:hypothetical protein
MPRHMAGSPQKRAWATMYSRILNLGSDSESL